MDLDGYKVTLRKNAVLGTWFWSATTPSGETLAPLFGIGWVDKANAESNALRRIETHQATEELSGEVLRSRVAART